MIRVVGPCRLPTVTKTNVRCQNGKTLVPPTRVSVASTSTTCPPTFFFGTELVTTNHTNHSDDGQHSPAAFNFETAAASRHAQAKRVSRTPATAPPKWSSNTTSRATGDGKRQKTAPAHEDPCCPCLILSSCSKRNCPCTKAWWPGQNCNPSCGRCANMVAVHNAVIQDANRVHLPPSSTVARFCIHMGLPPRPLIPLIVNPAEHMGDDNESAPMASPCIQLYIRPDRQRQDGTQSTLSRASHEGDKVVMSPDVGDTSPPTKTARRRQFGRAAVCQLLCPPNPVCPTLGCDSDASIDATLLTNNRPPPAFAPSGAPFQPGTSTTIGSSNTPCVKSLTQQSTVSGAVVAGQPAADCENVDGGSMQEMAASKADHLGRPGAALNLGLTQGMVALVDCLGTRVAAPNVGPMR
jgi:hypothetical protein